MTKTQLRKFELLIKRFNDDHDGWIVDKEKRLATYEVLENAFNLLSENIPCECCDDRGYLEVTHEDSCEYIEACQECDYFGIIGNDQNDRARIKAISDGYQLTSTGKIKE